MNEDLDIFVERNDILCRSWNKIDNEACRIPSLSELIEACGDKIKGLQTSIKGDIYGWIAWTKDVKLKGFGELPEEAVANLWLELNKNELSPIDTPNMVS